MRSLPWFPFWVDRFHASKWVRRMTAEQVGVYTFLLCEQWDAGAVVDDDNELSYICRAPIDEVRTVLAWCFDLNEEGMWINPALETIRAEQEDKANMRSLAGRKGAESRWNKGGNGNRIRPHSERNAIPMAIEVEVEEEQSREERENEADGLSIMLKKYPDAQTALDAMTHKSRAATDATLRMSFLYADGGGMPDPSVKGETLERRGRLVAAALLELAGQGETDWNPRLLAGYLRRIRKQPDSTSEAASVKDGDPQWEATKRAALEAERKAIAELNTVAVVKVMPSQDTRYDGRKKTKAIIDLLTAKRASE
jgi:uncharacterized protein YdaU (DUF1376 family)